MQNCHSNVACVYYPVSVLKNNHKNHNKTFFVHLIVNSVSPHLNLGF